MELSGSRCFVVLMQGEGGKRLLITHINNVIWNGN